MLSSVEPIKQINTGLCPTRANDAMFTLSPIAAIAIAIKKLLAIIKLPVMLSDNIPMVFTRATFEQKIRPFLGLILVSNFITA